MGWWSFVMRSGGEVPFPACPIDGPLSGRAFNYPNAETRRRRGAEGAAGAPPSAHNEPGRLFLCDRRSGSHEEQPERLFPRKSRLVARGAVRDNGTPLRLRASASLRLGSSKRVPIEWLAHESDSCRPPPLSLLQPLRHFLIALPISRPSSRVAIPAVVLDGHVDAAIDEELHRLVVVLENQRVQDARRLVGVPSRVDVRAMR